MLVICKQFLTLIDACLNPKQRNQALFFPFPFVVSKLFTTFVAKIKSPQKILIMTTYRFAITGLRQHDFANRLDELYDEVQGSVCRRKALKAFFECHNQVDLLTIHQHFFILCVGKIFVRFRHHKSKTNVNHKRYK